MIKTKLVILFLLFSTIGFSQTNQSKLMRELDRTRNQIRKINRKKTSTVRKLRLINREISLEKRYVNNLKRTINKIDRKIKKNIPKIKKTEKKIKSLQKEYEELIYYAYKTRNSRRKSMYIFSANSFTQAYKRFKYLQFFTDYIQFVTDDLKKHKDSLMLYNLELEKQKNKKNFLQEKKADEIIRLSSQQKNKKRLIRKLRKQRKRLLADLKRKRKNSASLRSSVTAETSKASNKPKSKASKKFEGNKGRLIMPAYGVITAHFGTHKHPVLENITIRNDGIDISVGNNTSVKCVFKGKVSKIVTIPGANKAILIKHGEYFTVYSNLVNVTVSAGDTVYKGQKIGKVFKQNGKPNSGILNFQIWYGKEKLNPEKWIK